MFDEDREFYTLAERALDAYSFDELFDLLDVDPINALVELQLAGVVTLNERTLPEIFTDTDEE